jgi:hypothetical protein
MSTPQPLAYLGAIAAFVGVVLLIISTLLHSFDSDPSDAPAAFAEYATDSHYVWSHLGQFVGFFGLGIGLVAFAATLEPGQQNVQLSKNYFLRQVNIVGKRRFFFYKCPGIAALSFPEQRTLEIALASSFENARFATRRPRE